MAPKRKEKEQIQNPEDDDDDPQGSSSCPAAKKPKAEKKDMFVVTVKTFNHYDTGTDVCVTGVFTTEKRAKIAAKDALIDAYGMSWNEIRRRHGFEYYSSGKKYKVHLEGDDKTVHVDVDRVVVNPDPSNDVGDDEDDDGELMIPAKPYGQLAMYAVRGTPSSVEGAPLDWVPPGRLGGSQSSYPSSQGAGAGGRTYLNVPFAMKDNAKSMGAKWDMECKQWYVPEGVDASRFAKWRS